MPANTALQFFGSLLFGPGAFPITPNLLFAVAYPSCPGWVSADRVRRRRLFERPAAERKKIFLRIGLAAIASSSCSVRQHLRDLSLDRAKERRLHGTLLSQCHNTPLHCCSLSVCWGSSLLILSAMEGKDNSFTRGLSVYGRIPLFYFIVHMYLSI